MKLAKVAQLTSLAMILLFTALVSVVEARASDDSAQDNDTYYNESSVDPDGPEQDPRYSEDDRKWDELDNSVNEEDDE